MACGECASSNHRSYSQCSQSLRNGVGARLSGHTTCGVCGLASSWGRWSGRGVSLSSVALSELTALGDNFVLVSVQHLLGSSLLLSGRLLVLACLVLDVGLAVLGQVPGVATDDQRSWQCQPSQLLLVEFRLRIFRRECLCISIAHLVGALFIHQSRAFDVNIGILQALVPLIALCVLLGGRSRNCGGVLLLLHELFCLLRSQANRVACDRLGQSRTVFLLEVLDTIDGNRIGSNIMVFNIAGALFSWGVFGGGIFIRRRGRHLGQGLVLYRIRNLGLSNSCAAKGECASQYSSG